jgi:hypothetical protein
MLEKCDNIAGPNKGCFHKEYQNTPFGILRRGGASGKIAGKPILRDGS